MVRRYRIVLRGLLAPPVAAETALQYGQVFGMLAFDDLVHLQRAGIDAEPALLSVADAQQPDDLCRVRMQVQFAVGRIAARSFRDIRNMPEIVAIGALRNA